MKNKLPIAMVLLLLSITSLAQAPEKLSYQAIIRDNNNNLVINQVIRMRLGIYRTSTMGVKVFEEVQTPTTNVNGLASLQIGTGTVTAGSIDTIAWENGPYFLKREIDISGGTNYNISGETELLSVPYALYTKKVENYAAGDYKLNYLLAPIQATNPAVTILTTTQNWEGNRRIMMNGYVTFDMDMPAAAVANNIMSGTANVSLYLKYDGQVIMPLDFKNIRVEDNAHITLPVMALIPNSTKGTSKQFSIICTDNTSESDQIAIPPSTILGPYPLDVTLTVVLTWLEL